MVKQDSDIFLLILLVYSFGVIILFILSIVLERNFSFEYCIFVSRPMLSSNPNPNLNPNLTPKLQEGREDGKSST